LIASIAENGIREPLQGIFFDNTRVLLDGFKRLRCARKLNINIIPYRNLSEDGAMGIIDFLRMSNRKKLSILEEAKLIDELQIIHKMATSDIAKMLDKSKSWVSVRSGLIKEISDKTMNRIMDGQFPVYAYMYILRPFIRINKIEKKEIDIFVDMVSGKGLSIRDIKILAKGYFEGSDEFRQQFRNGDISWGFDQLKKTSSNSDCSTIEFKMLKDLEATQKYMQRVSLKSQDNRFKSNSFYAQANLLSGGILSQMDVFIKAIRKFHDRSTKT